MQTVGGIDRVLAPFVKHSLVERQFFFSQFLRPHPCHKVKVFLLVGTHTVIQGFRQASIGDAMSGDLVAKEVKTQLRSSFLRIKRGDAVLSHDQ